MLKKNYNQFTSSKSKGFSLIELLVVISIIGVLSTIVVLALASPSKAKTNDAKTTSQLSQMVIQSFLFTGIGSSYVTLTPYQINNDITGATSGGTDASGILFNDTDIASNSLYLLASKLPRNTYVYYGWNGEPTATSGKWFFAASTSFGAFCVDWQGEKQNYDGSPLTDADDWVVHFPGAVDPTYTCN